MGHSSDLFEEFKGREDVVKDVMLEFLSWRNKIDGLLKDDYSIIDQIKTCHMWHVLYFFPWKWLREGNRRWPW